VTVKLFSPPGIRRIGLDVGRNADIHRGSDWIGSVSEFVDWVGLDLAKWTHVQLCVKLLSYRIINNNKVNTSTARADMLSRAVP